MSDKVRNLKPSKIAVIGAGQVGATIAFNMAITNRAAELVLVDVAVDKAEGEVLDTATALPIMKEMSFTFGGYEEVAGADIIVMSAGAGRKPGETRLDLAAKNVRIAKSVTDEMMKHYDGGIIIVVANPCDVIAQKMQEWTGIPREKVISSGTLLDSMRLRYHVAQHLGVDSTDVHAYMFGEHGETQFPLWSKSTFGGIPLDQAAKALGKEWTEEIREDIWVKTRTGGAEIIKRKGATFYGIGVSVDQLCQRILNNTSSLAPIGIKLEGEYGIDGVVLSAPAILGSDGVTKIVELDLTDEEMALFQASADNLRKTLDIVKDI